MKFFLTFGLTVAAVYAVNWFLDQHVGCAAAAMLSFVAGWVIGTVGVCVWLLWAARQ